ncbi:hypothetical protein Tco_0670857, partial [Tanacetum coccineum]
LVPSCFVIFDLEPLSLSFDFVFMSEIFKSFSFSLDHLCHLVILCLDQHAHTSHLFESLLTISLDRLDILKEDLFEHEHVIQRISLTGFPAQSVGSSNTDVLDLPCLLVLIIETSQSRQHVDTSSIHMAPTAVLFDDDTGRISIRHLNDVPILLRGPALDIKELVRFTLVRDIAFEPFGGAFKPLCARGECLSCWNPSVDKQF